MLAANGISFFPYPSRYAVRYEGRVTLYGDGICKANQETLFGGADFYTVAAL